jgi:hypothetical protein
MHIDSRYHFIRENVEDGIMTVEFVNSSENVSDIFTKNVSQDTYRRHAETFLGSIEDFKRMNPLV